MGHQQFLRRCKLLLGGQTQALDLSELEVEFHVRQANVGVPGWAIIRVYNMSDATMQQVEGEFQTLELSVGYGEELGVIFSGQIRQFNAGRRVNATDTFIDFVCQDGDEGYNWAIVNKSLAAGWTHDDQLKVLEQGFGDYNVQRGYVPALPPTKFPRGKVMYGAARDHMHRLAHNVGAEWSIHNGKIDIIPQAGKLPDEAVVLTADTGLLGLPEQTVDGITLQCLINPRIRYGSIVKLDNSSIQTANLNIAYSAVNYIPGFDRDGLYKVYSVNHTGDTRGNEWHSDLICVGLSAGAPISGPYINAVANNGP